MTETGLGLPQRVLVTGASGFVGTNLVRRLSALGLSIGALSRTPPPDLATTGATWLECDLTETVQAIAVIEAFAPEAIVHLAALPDAAEDFAQTDRAISGTLMATASALEGARRAGCRAFVYGDSAKVYGNGPVPHRATDPIDPTSSYAIAKAAGWEFCRLYQRLHDLPVLSLRPTIIFGPGQRRNLFSVVIDKVLNGASELYLDGGEQTRDPIYIDDAVDAFVRAVERAPHIPGRVICLGGGTERTVVALARSTVERMGSRLRIESRPGSARPTEIWRSFCDNLEAGEALGWQPRVSFGEGLCRTIEYAVRYRGLRLLV